MTDNNDDLSQDCAPVLEAGDEAVAGDQLLEAARRQAEFASMVAHEVRNSLTAIEMAIESALKGIVGPDDEHPRKTLATARRNVDRLARLTNQVLDFQKLEAGQLDLEPAPCDLRAVVSGVLEALGPVAGQKGLTLALEPSEEDFAVSCDEDRITQVLMNLAHNAIKFTAGGRVSVALSRGAGEVRVTVRDQGPGIAAEDQNKLFRSFVQLSGISRTNGGSGLGLAICRRIVEGHGGSIGVDSAPGRGAAFYFTLPAAESS